MGESHHRVRRSDNSPEPADCRYLSNGSLRLTSLEVPGDSTARRARPERDCQSLGLRAPRKGSLARMQVG
jgi:hypothetical protein